MAQQHQQHQHRSPNGHHQRTPSRGRGHWQPFPQYSTGPEEGYSWHLQQHPQNNHRYPPQMQQPPLEETTSSRIPWSPGEALLAPLMASSSGSIDSQDGNNAASSCSICWRLCCCCCPSNNRRRSRQAESQHLDDNGWFESHQQQQHHHHHGSHHHQERRGRTTAGICYKLLYIVLAVLSFGGLYHYSGRCDQQQWSMHSGESRHVPTAGFLTNTVQIISRTPSSSPSSSSHKDSNHNGTDPDTGDSITTRGIAVYAVEHSCPPLTGPPVNLNGPTQHLELLHNAFEYQYFYLNEGSTMKVTVHQLQGATNIMVLKGSKVLARIQDKRSNGGGPRRSDSHGTFIDTLFSNVVDLDFSVQGDYLVLEQFSSWAEDGGGPIEFSFTSPSSDVYVLLYDNAAANEAATLDVQYDMVLTTYYLKGLVPWCSHSAPVPPLLSWQPSFVPEDNQITSFSCPPLDTSKAGCILVEAIEHSNYDPYSNHTNSSSSISSTVSDTVHSYLELGEGLVEVTLYNTRKWLYIGGLSVLPSLLLSFMCYCRQLRKRRPQYRHRHDEYHYSPGLPTPRQQQSGQQHQASWLRQEQGPGFHFLPVHHQDGNDHDQTTTNNEYQYDNSRSERQEVPKENASEESTAEAATREPPCPIETEHDTAVVAAENVTVVQNQSSD